MTVSRPRREPEPTRGAKIESAGKPSVKNLADQLRGIGTATGHIILAAEHRKLRTGLTMRNGSPNAAASARQSLRPRVNGQQGLSSCLCTASGRETTTRLAVYATLSFSLHNPAYRTLLNPPAAPNLPPLLRRRSPSAMDTAWISRNEPYPRPSLPRNNSHPPKARRA